MDLIASPFYKISLRNPSNSNPLHLAPRCPLPPRQAPSSLPPPSVCLPAAALPLSLSSSRRQQIHRSRPGSRAPPAGSITCRPGRAVPALPGWGTAAAWPGAAVTSRAARLQLAPGAASTAPAPRLRLLATSSSAGAALLGWQRLPLASQIRPPLLEGGQAA